MFKSIVLASVLAAMSLSSVAVTVAKADEFSRHHRFERERHFHHVVVVRHREFRHER